MDEHHRTTEIFGHAKALIGMIHLAALPGTPLGRKTVAEMARAAASEARVYRKAGFDGLLIENMHDVPYLNRTVGPEITAAMTVAGLEVRAAVDLPLGVQVLAGANRQALAIAHACGAAFIRAEGFTFAHVADEGLIEADAGELLRYRRAIGAEGIHIFADIKKKHSAHTLTADVDLVETAHAAEFFLVDGVVVTGGATGQAASAEEVRAVSQAARVPTLVGSGITPDNLTAYAGADAFIVGSWVKEDGHWARPLDPARAETLVHAFQDLVRTSRRSAASARNPD